MIHKPNTSCHGPCHNILSWLSRKAGKYAWAVFVLHAAWHVVLLVLAYFFGVHHNH